MSTASGKVVRKGGTGARKPISTTTWVILAIIVVVTFGSLIAVLAGWWPLDGGVEQPPAGTITATSPNAAYVKVEKVGDPVRQADGQVVVKVKITNDKLMQSPAVVGTPTPGVPTPLPVPAKIINATVKVIFYDRPAADTSRKIVGSAVGNYYDPQGLADGDSATIDVVATGVGDFKDYAIYPDTVFTDKDPVKTPQPGASLPRPVQMAARIP